MAKSIDVKARLAQSLKRRDEIVNQQLASEIVKAKDMAAIEDLVATVTTGTAPEQNNCIKVLYEIGEKDPRLISAHLDIFLQLLPSKNNRVQWGAMTAISTIAKVAPDPIFSKLSKIITAGEMGSVITKDKLFLTLIELYGISKYQDSIIGLLKERLVAAAENQLPRYAEIATEAVSAEHHFILLSVLQQRLPDLQKASSLKRVQAVTRKLNG